MTDREKVIKGIEQFRADLKPFCGNHADWERFDAGLSLLKEQEVVRCKDCVHREKSEKCVLAAISKEKDFPLFMLDNRGEWFCADGERR